MVLKKQKKIRSNFKPSRKQLRKEKRKDKKVRRNEYYTKRSKNLSTELNNQKEVQTQTVKTAGEKQNYGNKTLDKVPRNKILSTEEQNKKEKREQKKLQKNMSKQRKQQLLEANLKEDQTIKKLEKQLKLNKRKSKSIPKSFAIDGLDYLLEACDPEYMKSAVSTEQDLYDANDEFEEDFVLMTGHKTKTNKKKSEKRVNKDIDEFSDSGDSIEDLLEGSGEENVANEDLDDEYFSESSNHSTELFKKKNKSNIVDTVEESMDEKTESENESVLYSVPNSEDEKGSQKVTQSKKRKLDTDKAVLKKKKQKLHNKKSESVENQPGDYESIDEDTFSDLAEDNEFDGDISKKQDNDEVWEDIYGRLRTKDGGIMSNSAGKYIPPAIRAKLEGGSEDKKHKEKLDRLKKQLKGLLNRLAESNMHNIATQIESLFMNNSRNDMNETLNALIIDSLVGTVLTPERLLMEHVMLMVILHANVGTEVGAHFLQTIVKKFERLLPNSQNIEDKTLDNVINILSQLYNFKVFDAKLLYEILHKLSSNFEEKNIECILHILKSVGFGLRKDDPIALKNLILELQKQAASVSEGKVSNSRVKFLLDILLAIKNNNVTKIPNYDTSYSEHLKKIMKGFIRKGNYVTSLNITLEDLLKADERGKWWVVGSAWTGKTEKIEAEDKNKETDNFSKQLLELARKQRMNTDTRRNIFCVIMSAEDYLDAFEKLLRLGLKNQQEREIIHVILHCCLQEKVYNPYYAVLAQKFCEYDRKFQMTIKYSVWDKLKVLNNHSGGQLSNLAKLLTHLFIEKGLSISTLKIVEFSELDKVSLRFMRQILLGILLHNDVDALLGVFEKVAQSDKLKLFRESLRLFIHHFLLRNLKSDLLPEDQKKNLEDRAKIVEKILIARDSRLRL